MLLCDRVYVLVVFYLQGAFSGVCTRPLGDGFEEPESESQAREGEESTPVDSLKSVSLSGCCYVYK